MLREFKTEQEWLDFAIKNIAGKQIPNTSYGSGYLGNSLEILIHGRKVGNKETDLIIEGKPWELKTYRGNNTISCSKTKIDYKNAKQSYLDHVDYTCKKMKNLILFKFHETYDVKNTLELISFCNEIQMFSGMVKSNFQHFLSTRPAKNKTVFESNINLNNLTKCYRYGRNTPPIIKQKYEPMPNIFDEMTSLFA